MKIVVGIDPSHSSANVAHLLKRLAFPQSEAIYGSFAPYPVVPPPGLSSAPDELIQRMMGEQRGIACRAMREAMLNLGDVAPGEEMVFELGNPVHLLEHLAEDHGAELIAIGSRPHRPLEAGLLGSVGRGLALNSKVSTLIAKGEVAKEGPVKAVFAYDASDCCEKAIDLLVKMRPAGLTHVDVVIVDTPDPSRSPVTDLRGEGAFSLGRERRRDLLLSYARPAAERLAAAGYETRALCPEGSPAVAIRGAVVDLHADLVVLGARGHRWLERVLLGSFALEQAVDEPHSVLILRPTH